jgi:hypothetical protein
LRTATLHFPVRSTITIAVKKHQLVETIDGLIVEFFGSFAESGFRSRFEEKGSVKSFRREIDGLVLLSRQRAILIHAATAAELERSRRGVNTVAQSLSLLGKDEAAVALVARVRPDWANDTIGLDDIALLEGCSSTAKSLARQ